MMSSNLPVTGSVLLPAALFQQKLASYENERSHVSLAAEMRLVLEMAIEEIKSLEEDMCVPSLGFFKADLEALKTFAQAVVEKGAESLPPIGVAQSPNIPVEATERGKAIEQEVAGYWQGLESWQAFKVYKHVDTLSEYCFRIGATIEWDEVGALGVRLQRALGCKLRIEDGRDCWA